MLLAFMIWFLGLKKTDVTFLYTLLYLTLGLKFNSVADEFCRSLDLMSINFEIFIPESLGFILKEM